MTSTPSSSLAWNSKHNSNTFAAAFDLRHCLFLSGLGALCDRTSTSTTSQRAPTDQLKRNKEMSCESSVNFSLMNWVSAYQDLRRIWFQKQSVFQISLEFCVYKFQNVYHWICEQWLINNITVNAAERGFHNHCKCMLDREGRKNLLRSWFDVIMHLINDVDRQISGSIHTRIA